MGRDDLVEIRNGVRYLKADLQRVAEGHGEGPHDDRDLVITTQVAQQPAAAAAPDVQKGGEQRASNRQGAAGKPE